MYPNSESITALTRGGPGILVHRASKSELVTLYYVNAQPFDHNGDDNNEVRLKIYIGNRDFFILIHPGGQQKILDNIPLCANEEIWISTNIVNIGAVYGTCVKV